MVARALTAMLPQIELDGPDAAVLEISDEGARFAVAAAGQVRRFEDPPRRCEERARKAAVFAALALQPPQIAAPAPPPPRPPSPTDDVRAPSVEVEVAGLFANAALGPTSTPTGGASAKLFVGGRFVGGVVGISALGPTTLSLGAVGARLLRVPVELAIRGRLFLRRVTLSVDLGLVLAAQITDGLDVAASVRQARLELGVAGTARVEYWPSRRLAPFFAFSIEGVPAPYDLDLPGVGVVGRTPRLWLGAALGLAVRLR